MKELLIRAKFFEGTCDKIFADLHTACKAAVALANDQSGSPRPTLSKSDSNPRWQASHVKSRPQLSSSQEATP